MYTSVGKQINTSIPTINLWLEQTLISVSTSFSHHSLWMPITRFCPWHWLQRSHEDGDTETWELHNNLLICGSNSLQAQDSLFVMKPKDQIRDDGIPDALLVPVPHVHLFVRSEASRKTPRIEVQSPCLSSRREGVLKSCVLLRRVCDYQKNMWKIPHVKLRWCWSTVWAQI